MTRRVKVDRENNEAAADLANMVKPRRAKSSSRKGPTRAGIDRMMGEAQEMRASGDWSKGRPVHLVAVYAWCHEQTYEVFPTELVGLNWMAAASSAAKLLREEFDGSVERGIAFLKWTWGREREREEWRRANSKEGGRISWRAQFQQRMILTDYRIFCARKSNGRR